MAYLKKLTIEEHLEVADSLAIVNQHISKIYYMIQKNYGKSHKLCKLLNRILPNNNSGLMIQIKGELDKEFLKETKDLTNEEFHEKYGFIHYNYNERYKDALKRQLVIEDSKRLCTCCHNTIDDLEVCPYCSYLNQMEEKQDV